MQSTYPHLFAPLHVRSMRLPNRIVSVEDCVQAREILSAVREAYDTALRV